MKKLCFLPKNQRLISRIDRWMSFAVSIPTE